MGAKQTELMDLFKMLMQEKNADNEKDFIKKLNETMFWIPADLAAMGESINSFALLITADGRKFVPAFVYRKSNLGRFTEEQLVEIPYTRLKYLVIDSPVELDGIVISPFEENIVLNRKNMEIIDARTMGLTLHREDHRERVKLRKPDFVPENLMKELKQFFENTIEVKSAWILKAKREKNLDEHWLLLIDFYGQKIKLFPKVAEVMKPYIKPGERFELIQKMPDVSENEIEPARIYFRSTNRNLF